MPTNSSHMQDRIAYLVFPHFIGHGTNSQHKATCYHISEHIFGWGLYSNFTFTALTSQMHVHLYHFLPFLARRTCVQANTLSKNLFVTYDKHSLLISYINNTKHGSLLLTL